MAKRSKRLGILCPQLYDGMEMRVTGCDRCDNWDAPSSTCTVYIGCEHLPLVPAAEIPPCPIEARCQHQAQSLPAPCPVRARGMICESALRHGGVEDPEGHPLAFHAMTVASEREWLENQGGPRWP